MFLKERRDGSSKARGCADGRLKREYMTKSDNSSPTVWLEAMMLLGDIHAKEGRNVAVTNKPGALLHANMKQDVHMLFEGTIAELIIKFNPRL